MRNTKKILGFLLSGIMLLSMLSVGVFAAEGDQSNPINANEKWFGSGVDCFLLNTTLEANDADGVWYELTADADGILQLEHVYNDVDYQVTLTVNGKEYLGYEDGVYNAPIVTYPVAVGDVISIHIIAQDTTLGGTVYCNAKFVSGEGDATIKVKSAPAKMHVAAGATVYFQDDTLQAEYATQYVTLSGDSVENVTLFAAGANASGTIVKQMTYTDVDGDGVIEGQLTGSQGSAGAPAVKPAWIITNDSNEDRCFTIAVVEEAHECVYDDDTHTDCTICGGVTPPAGDEPIPPVVDKPTIQVYVEDTEVNAGDEIEVTVNLNDLDLTEGLIGAQVEIGFDPAAFELVTYFDEDEEMWLPQIEVGSKYNASSNKYIMFAPIDEDTGFSEKCLVQYVRATASASQVRKEAHFYTATFKVKDDAVSGTYELYVNNYNPKNIVAYGNVATNCAIQNCSITINGTEPACEHEYTYACDKVCAKCGELTNETASHNLQHTPAAQATCIAEGNLEYWHCDICGAAWLDEACTLSTNLMAVKLPTSDHAYDNDMDVDCNVCGEVRVVDYVVKTFGGNSIAESNDGVSGLAFYFNLTDKIQGLALVEGTLFTADYTNATVTPNPSGTYKLVSMGAEVSNGQETLDIPVREIFMEGDGAPYYVIRIINIPEEHYGTAITCVPYFVYENAEGEQVTVHGESYTACAADFMG